MTATRTWPTRMTPAVCLEWQAWMGGQVTRDYFRHKMVQSFAMIRAYHDLSKQQSAECLAELEDALIDTLVNGETIMLKQATCSLVSFASTQFPAGEKFDADQATVRSGVIFLEEPFALMQDDDGRDILVDALAFWDSRSGACSQKLREHVPPLRNAGDFQVYWMFCRVRGERMLCGAGFGTTFTFNGLPLEDQSSNAQRIGNNDGIEMWVCNPRAWLQSLWALMSQPIVAEEKVRPVEPPARKARKKLKGGQGGDVRVLHLRQRERSASVGDGEKKYTLSHRFVVRGFWRNQFYGKDRALRRRMWIDSYIKGPTDAPLRVGDRVYKE